MRWAGHAARIEEKRNANRIMVGKPEGKSHWEDQEVVGWTILKWILDRLGLIWLRIGTSGRLL
jgi:hypothetical protein